MAGVTHSLPRGVFEGFDGNHAFFGPRIVEYDNSPERGMGSE
jgi:hypothetical protein